MTTSEKNTKNLTLNPSFSLEPPPPPGFDFLSQKPVAQPIFSGCLSIFSTKTGPAFSFQPAADLLPFSFISAFPHYLLGCSHSSLHPSHPLYLPPPHTAKLAITAQTTRLLLQKQRPADPLPSVSSFSSSDGASPCSSTVSLQQSSSQRRRLQLLPPAVAAAAAAPTGAEQSAFSLRWRLQIQPLLLHRDKRTPAAAPSFFPLSVDPAVPQLHHQICHRQKEQPPGGSRLQIQS